MSLLDNRLPSAPEVWALWQRGVADRRSPFRTPAIATVGTDGQPEVRTVVLRDAQLQSRTLTLHSDRRASKVAALHARPTLAWHFWNPRQRLQLRATGTVCVHSEGALVERAWNRLSAHQQRTYAAHPAPGSALNQPGDGLPASRPDLQATGRPHFCVVICTLDTVDLLALRREGHRRARLCWTGTDWSATWLVP